VFYRFGGGSRRGLIFPKEQHMFKDAPAFTSFSVDDLEVARKFYEQTLGIEVVDRDEEGYPLLALHVAQGAPVTVYAKPNHQPASYTVLNFVVGDIDQTVDQLAGKGVRFEKYDGDIKTDAKGISRNNGPQIAWFRDPAGNILSVLQGR
jgi:catechol 2,3-dioxygenase-like lactoylglutathione lyase family enzyme